MFSPVVIVTARNEELRLGATLAALKQALPTSYLIVADDNSCDHTAAIAKDMGAQLVPNPDRPGKGQAASAAVAAIPAELRQPDQVFLFCDGDLGSSAARLTLLVEDVRAGTAEVSVAAFASSVGGGFGIALGFARRTILAYTGRELRAPISGQRALSAQALEAVTPFAGGFGMELAMTVTALRAGLAVLERELELEHRASGKSVAGFVHRGRQLRDFVRVRRTLRSP